MGKSSRKKKVSDYNTVKETTLETRHIRETKNPQYLLAGLVSLITFFVYLACLRNEFVNWDDNVYVYENANIKSFSVVFLKWAFLSSHAGYWFPLTWISHALDYALWGLNPLGHHLTNVIIHAVNTFFVAILVIRLVEARQKATAQNWQSGFPADRTNLITGVITGLLFGLHPLHVESVAWVAERKDLLCALFFVLSILEYTKYVSVIDNESAQKTLKVRFLNKHYLSALGFFVLSLLSKPMAVTLSCVLLLLDWYPFSRIQSFKALLIVFIEKLPFITFSIISSGLTILTAKAAGAMVTMKTVPLSTRLLVAVKSLIVYLWKMILPIDLIPFYPYPRDVSILSLPYALTIVLTIGITVICIVIVRKGKLWLSLWVYYVVTLIPVVGIIQVGNQSMGDRFTYLPSIGPFIMMALAIAWSWSRVVAFRKKRTPVKLFGISMFMLFIAMTYLTFEQISVWKDSMTLWSYVIEKEPVSAPLAYNNRGMVFENMGRFDKAIEDYDKAITLNPSFFDAYNNRGIVFENMGRFDKAIEDFSKAIALKPNDSMAFVNRGLVYLKLGQAQQAIIDLNRACELGNAFGCNAPQYIKQ